MSSVRIRLPPAGEVDEWFKSYAWRAYVALAIVGSNPTLSSDNWSGAVLTEPFCNIYGSLTEPILVDSRLESVNQMTPKNRCPSSRSLNILLAIALRMISVEMVQHALSGHLGAPMGMAEIICALYFHSINHNPLNPGWQNRDRIVFSNGHCSALLYSVLHLAGFKLFVEDLRSFRKFRSITPGHPEYRTTPGVEASTGPLGQGLANAVGMALAEALLCTEFNRPNYKIIDHKTYVLVGDGCLMEGVSHEVCSLAGVLKLSKLIVLYDENHVSIDGNTRLSCLDDTSLRFRSYDWNVISVAAGHCSQSILSSIRVLKNSAQPNIILIKTIIGKGCVSQQGTASVHGTLSSAKHYTSIRKYYGWNSSAFQIPSGLNSLRGTRTTAACSENRWSNLFYKYFLRFPTKACELKRRLGGHLPDGWFNKIRGLLKFAVNTAQILSTRKASQLIIERLVPLLPEMLGGSADLTHSNLTSWPGCNPVVTGSGQASGNYIHYGVREFGMSAIMNGIVLHGGFRVYGGTFLAFSDYSKSAIRLSALTKIPTIFLFTHDSVAVGEDGPTHQPIEQVPALRLIPDHTVWRPSGLLECAVSWFKALQSSKPTSLVLSRQHIKPVSWHCSASIKDMSRGGYILRDWSTHHSKKLIIVFTGSELQLATGLMAKLADESINIRLVSMPSYCSFNGQDTAYKSTILPPEARKIYLEASRMGGWHGRRDNGELEFGVEGFGKSGGTRELLRHFGLDVNTILKKTKELMSRC